MAAEVNPEMVTRLSGQYSRMLRLSLTAEVLDGDAEWMMLRRAILARYRDLVQLGRGAEAKELLAWRDAERARLHRSIGSRAA